MISKQELLADTVSIRAGSIDPRQFPNETFELFSLGDYPGGEPKIVMSGELRGPKKEIFPGDVLFSRLRPEDPKVWIVPPKGEYRQIASIEFIPLVCDPKKITPHYLRYYLFHLAYSGIIGRIVRHSTINMDRIGYSDILIFRIALPDLRTQDKVCKILGLCEDLTNRKKTAKGKTDRLKRSIFNGSLANTTNVHSVTLASLGVRFNRSSRRGTDNSCSQAGNSELMKVRVIDQKNIKDGVLDTGEAQIAWDDLSRSSQTSLLQPDDVLLTTIGSKARAAVAPKNIRNTISGRNVARICVDPEKCLPEYLAAALNYEDRILSYLEMNVPRSTIPRLDLMTLRRIPIPLPMLEDQQKIISRLDQVDQISTKNSESLEKMKMLFKSLLHVYFTEDPWESGRTKRDYKISGNK